MIPPASPADLAALATLGALLEEGSVTAAAHRLGLSVPAVSHALARLRERFADPLLVRAGRGMVLTPRAQALRPQVEAALAAAHAVFAQPEAFDPAALRRAFTLCLTDYVLTVFGDAIERLVCAQAPGVDLRFIPNAPDDPERLRAGEADLAIGIYAALPPELKARPLITDRLVCVARAAHPTLAQASALTVDQLVALDHVQIAPRGRPGGYVDDQLARLGLARRVARAVPYFQTALAMTARADYLLIVSERLALQAAPQLNLRVFEPPEALDLKPFALSMVWHPRFDGDAAHQWLRATLAAACAEVAPDQHPDARRADEAAGPPRKRRRAR